MALVDTQVSVTCLTVAAQADPVTGTRAAALFPELVTP